ncbi:DUF192 domain-containing protein [Thalassobacillus sp. C254]|uniref:DUF192 domain-containing protein n=1 Tax=Thalassobacillus sp. C254 TaxID=1225341 RepID=UPI0009F90EF5|nr:DUF192 domain-containing protein [Thalassobacillus sp. C254]
MKVIDRHTRQVIANEGKEASTFWKRFKGLMFTKSIPDHFALHITPCPSIHTFFMKYPIDVIYLNHNKEVIGMEENLKPGRVGKRVPGARSVLELPAGRIRKTAVTKGQSLVLVRDNTNKEVGTLADEKSIKNI